MSQRLDCGHSIRECEPKAVVLANCDPAARRGRVGGSACVSQVSYFSGPVIVSGLVVGQPVRGRRRSWACGNIPQRPASQGCGAARPLSSLRGSSPATSPSMRPGAGNDGCPSQHGPGGGATPPGAHPHAAREARTSFARWGPASTSRRNEFPTGPTHSFSRSCRHVVTDVG